MTPSTSHGIAGLAEEARSVFYARFRDLKESGMFIARNRVNVERRGHLCPESMKKINVLGKVKQRPGQGAGLSQEKRSRS